MNKNILNQQDEDNNQMLENEKRIIVENKKLENPKLKKQIRIKKEAIERKLSNSSLKKSSERVETKKQNLLKKDEIYNIKQKEELQRQVNNIKNIIVIWLNKLEKNKEYWINNYLS